MLLFIHNTIYADTVRKSRNLVCHVKGESRWYDRLKYYEEYDSVHECLNPDGRSTKTDVYIPEYERNFFGSGWQDFDKDGKNTRAEILIEQSTGQIHFRSEQERIVDRGRWISIFTNDIITNAKAVDVDHIFSLKLGWVRGMYQMDHDVRVAFANDPLNLAAVEASLNRSKGAKGVLEWLPPENQCQYIIRTFRIAAKYDLEILQEERDLYSDVCSN